jgi:hypothetical protein
LTGPIADRPSRRQLRPADAPPRWVTGNSAGGALELSYTSLPFSIAVAPVDDPSLTPLVVRREVDGWLFVPGGWFGGLATGLFAAGAAFISCRSLISHDTPPARAPVRSPPSSPRH